ncbi:MAG TPA: hypothetical protein VF040_02605, partial [Ktedonobacterales bacterium]
MRGYRHVRKSLLALGMLFVALVAAAFPMAASGAPRATPRAPLATDSQPAESSKTILADTSSDGPALWTSNPNGSTPALAGVLAWTGTDPGHSLNIMQSSDGIHYGRKVIFAE